jgi:hypothetical protein
VGYTVAMISKRPSRFTAAELRWLCGVSPEQFGELVVRVGPRWEQERLERLSGRQRRRAVGAGRRYELVFSARLFVTLLHLRHNVPFRALGALVGMSKDTAHRAVVELVPLLAEVGITASDGSAITSVDDLREFFERRGPGGGALLDGTFIPRRALVGVGRHRSPSTPGTVTGTVAAPRSSPIYEGNVLFVGEAEDGPTHDITGARRSGIGEAAAGTDTTIIADRGYRGWGNKPTDPDGPKVLAPRPGGRRGKGTYNTEHARIRVASEHGIRSLKRFTVLHHYRRHSDTLTGALRAIAAITTLRPA